MLLHTLQSISGYSETVSPGPTCPALWRNSITSSRFFLNFIGKKLSSPKRRVSTSARKLLVQVLISEEPYEDDLPHPEATRS